MHSRSKVRGLDAHGIRAKIGQDFTGAGKEKNHRSRLPRYCSNAAFRPNSLHGRRSASSMDIVVVQRGQMG